MKKYSIGSYQIDIPDDHLLPVYQTEHPTYDRFLPYLLQEFEHSMNDTVVIVGANIGDTLAALCNVRPEFIFINFEPDEDFYSLLVSNTSIISSISEVEIINRKSYVGKAAKLNALVGEGGTKHAVFIEDELAKQIELTCLDEVLPTLLVGNLKLLIIDVDGFDWDVINSGLNVIQSQSPMIYFELYANDLQTLAEYFSSIISLEEAGYSFSIFDNFGNIVQENANSANVIVIMPSVNA